MAEGRTGREIILRLLRQTLVAAFACAAVAYALDFAVLRVRVMTNRSPYGTVTVRQVYAVPQKNHRTEFLLADPQDQTCTHSLFPQSGHAPCWYLESHRDQQVDM